MPSIKVCLLLAVLVAWPTWVAAAGSGDDAGSGRDAPPSAAAALVLPSDGPYAGRLSSAADADVFRRAATSDGAVCVAAETTPDAPTDLTLALVYDGPDGDVRRATRGSADAAGHAGGIAVPRLASAWLGLAASDGADGGDYAFTLAGRSRSDVGAGDAGTGLDAAPLAPSAMSGGGPCLGGDLSDADPRDVYALRSEPGRGVDLSFGEGRGIVVEAVSSAGTVLATLSAGDFSSFAVPADGAYYLSVATRATGGDLWTPPPVVVPVDGDVSSVRDYLLGLSISDDPGQGCRPQCSAV